MNRWHPDIPAVATVACGTPFVIETVDWTGYQIKNDDNADDVKNIDLSGCHYLSGPVAIEEAEVGDALLVEILDVTPFPQMPWGYTGVREASHDHRS